MPMSLRASGDAEAEVVESERAADFGGVAGVESPRAGNASLEFFRALVFAQIATSAGVDRAFRALGRGSHERPFVLDFPASAKTGIN